MNCYKVEFECTNYKKDFVEGNDKQYLTVEEGTLYIIAKDLKEVQEKLEPYKSKITSCVKVGLGF